MTIHPVETRTVPVGGVTINVREAGDPAGATAILLHGGSSNAATWDRVAEAGRLRVTERRAVELTRAAGTRVVLTLIDQAEDERDDALADMAWESVCATILVDKTAAAVTGLAAAAVTLRAGLPAHGSAPEAHGPARGVPARRVPPGPAAESGRTRVPRAHRRGLTRVAGLALQKSGSMYTGYIGRNLPRGRVMGRPGEPVRTD